MADCNSFVNYQGNLSLVRIQFSALMYLDSLEVMNQMKAELPVSKYNFWSSEIKCIKAKIVNNVLKMPQKEVMKHGVRDVRKFVKNITKAIELGELMLRLTIELVPFGNEDKAKKISVMEIANTAYQPELSYYRYRYSGWVLHMDGVRKMFDGIVQHNRTKMVYILIKEIIDEIIQPYI